MKWEALVKSLFDTQHTITEQDLFLQGTAEFEGQTLNVIGTTEHAPIGVSLALTQAQAVLDTIRHHPGRSLLLLVDTQGQQLRRRDELLGINRAMAHLGMCLDLARRKGHKVIGLVYDQALSGGFITSGLIADACYAVPEAEIRVMRIPAMARVTKLPEALLEELAQSNPVFAPGVDNYVAMGVFRLSGTTVRLSICVRHCVRHWPSPITRIAVPVMAPNAVVAVWRPRSLTKSCRHPDDRTTARSPSPSDYAGQPSLGSGAGGSGAKQPRQSEPAAMAGPRLAAGSQPSAR